MFNWKGTKEIRDTETLAAAKDQLRKHLSTPEIRNKLGRAEVARLVYCESQHAQKYVEAAQSGRLPVNECQAFFATEIKTEPQGHIFSAQFVHTGPVPKDVQIDIAFAHHQGQKASDDDLKVVINALRTNTPPKRRW